MAATKRSSNFSRGEVGVLVEEVGRRKELLFGKHDSGIEVNNGAKKRAWESIAEAVSTAGNSVRDVNSIKKKWADIKSATKKKAAKHKMLSQKTGGGPPPPPMDELEEKVASLIGPAAIEGVAGGIDSTHFREYFLGWLNIYV